MLSYRTSYADSAQRRPKTRQTLLFNDPHLHLPRLHLCPEVFDNDATQIIWAMSYMKTGHATRWAAREFELEAKKGHLRFIDWLDFEEEFQKDFTPLNAESTAVNTLETTLYFQGKRMVNDYLDQFCDLIYDSGYTDKKTIIVKFRHGLDRQIASALAGMASGRLSDTNPKAWFKLTIQIDQNRAADKAFQASHQQAHHGCNVPLLSQVFLPLLPSSMAFLTSSGPF